MIRIEQVFTLNPNFVEHLNDTSRAELESEPNWREVFATTDKVYGVLDDDIPLMLAGIRECSLLGGLPEIWVLLFRGFQPRHLRKMPFIVETMKELYSEGLEARVEAGNERAEKFANFFGFKRVLFGQDYNLYRMN